VSMWRLIWLLIILVVSIGLGLLIAKDPGVAFFSYRQWSVEMPLWFAVVSLILVLLIGYFFLRLFGRMDSAWYRLKNWLRWRRKNKAYSKTNRGLLELIEGNWKNAEYYLNEGIIRSDAPLVNYLALAKAAHEQGKYDRRDDYLRKAYGCAPHAEIAIGLTQAQFQMNQEQFEQALATLTHLRSLAPKQPQVLKTLERLYIHIGDWQNLIKLLPSLYKSRVLTRVQYAQLEKKAYQELLLSTAIRAESKQALQACWQTIPKKLKNDPGIIYCYAQQLSSYPEEADLIAGMIVKVLKKTWDAHLVRLYGLLVTASATKQLAQAEKWLSHYPQHAELFLTLGRLSMQCQLWGKARHYFEESLQLAGSSETYIEYGKLLEQLGDTTTALQNYREGLQLNFN